MCWWGGGSFLESCGIFVDSRNSLKVTQPIDNPKKELITQLYHDWQAGFEIFWHE
jgi:hypothetical protein